MKHPALIYVLRGLFPPTRENLLLSFKPGLFFAELSRVSGYKQQTLQQSFYRARRRGLISEDAIPKLTAIGQRKLQPYIAQKLGNHARLLLVYDIPEHMESERRALKRLLHNLDFELLQQSVWATDFDHRDTIRSTVKELDIAGCVQIFESVRLKI
jgi:DNA-binding transcriptional regulator PaaX